MAALDASQAVPLSPDPLGSGSKPESERPLNAAERYLNTLTTKRSVYAGRGALNTLCALAGMEVIEERVKGARARNVSYKHFAWHKLTSEDVNTLMARMRDAAYANASCMKMVAVLHGVFFWLWQTGVISFEMYYSIKHIKLRRVKDLKRGKKRAFTSNEQQRMIEAGKHERTKSMQARNNAIITLLAAGGFRPGELGCDFRLDDQGKTILEGFTFDKLNFTRKSITISFKRRTREVFLKDKAWERLEEWRQLHGKKSGAVFVAINGSGEIDLDSPLRGNAICRVVYERAKKAGIDGGCARWYRRAYATTLNRKGVSLKTIQELMGHENASTTLEYVVADEGDLLDAAALIDI